MKAVFVILLLVVVAVTAIFVSERCLYDIKIDTYWDDNGRKMYTSWFAGSEDEAMFKQKFPNAKIISQTRERRSIGE